MEKLPTDVPALAKWMKAARIDRDWSTTDLANRARAIAHRDGSGMKLTQQSVSGFEQGTAQRIPEWFRYVREALEADDAPPKPNGRNGIQSDQSPTLSADAGESVPILRLDLSLPMGPGATIDDFVEDEPLTFDLAYVRSFTRTPPHRLRLAGGAGDSMFPTLVSHDLVWIDTTQNQLLHSDRIYAASINGGAAIKRLRPVAGGRRVLVISDNKTVDAYEVDADEVVIWGRVIRFARDL